MPSLCRLNFWCSSSSRQNLVHTKTFAIWPVPQGRVDEDPMVLQFYSLQCFNKILSGHQVSVDFVASVALLPHCTVFAPFLFLSYRHSQQNCCFQCLQYLLKLQRGFRGVSRASPRRIQATSKMRVVVVWRLYGRVLYSKRLLGKLQVLV